MMLDGSYKVIETNPLPMQANQSISDGWLSVGVELYTLENNACLICRSFPATCISTLPQILFHLVSARQGAHLMKNGERD